MQLLFSHSLHAQTLSLQLLEAKGIDGLETIYELTAYPRQDVGSRAGTKRATYVYEQVEIIVQF